MLAVLFVSPAKTEVTLQLLFWLEKQLTLLKDIVLGLVLNEVAYNVEYGLLLNIGKTGVIPLVQKH